MTSRINNDTNRDRINQTGLLRWKNMSGETIPAYACVKLSAFNTTDRYYNAVKPDGEGSLYFFNGGIAIASEKFGESFIWGQSSVLGKTSGVFGETVGPVADSWEMTTEGTGFTVFSNPADGFAAILKAGGGGAGTHEIWFTIDSVICNGDLSKTLFVTPFKYTGPCGAAIPGEDEYGQVQVEDPCGILDFYTSIWLESGGVVGRATYMNPVGSEYCIPEWLVDTICGSPECA